MTHTPVNSSFIASVAHDPDARELHVAMHNGKTYAYAGVSAEHHAGLLAAPSAGAYYGAHIRGSFAARVVK